VKRPSVEDTLLIYDLYARYSWALDTGDTESYVALYAPDAVVYENLPDGVREARGHDEIREFVMRFHGNPDFPGRQHRTSQLVILPDPEGRENHWQVRTYVLTTETKEGKPPSLYWCGCAFDTVAKVDGEWLLAVREIKQWAGEILERFGAEAR
jgi:ketosteroid isomerase-like protein